MLHFIEKYPATIFFSTLISTLFFTIGAAPESLFFNQTAIINGEPWRLISAHFVHTDLEHLFWNVTAFLILSILIEQHNRTMLLVTLIAGIITIDYYLWFNTIGVINYAGISGVLNTMLVVALFQQWNTAHSLRILPVITYFACLIKIFIELFAQQSIFTQINWQPLPEVHLLGFFVGTVIIIIQFLMSKISSSTTFPIN